MIALMVGVLTKTNWSFSPHIQVQRHLLVDEGLIFVWADLLI